MTYCKNELMEQDGAYLRNNVNYVYICSADPTSYAEAVSYMLASAQINYWSWGGPYAGSNGGRKITLAQWTATVTTEGTGRFAAYVNTSTSVLWLTHPRTFEKELLIGETITVPAVDYEFGFPTIIPT